MKLFYFIGFLIFSVTTLIPVSVQAQGWRLLTPAQMDSLVNPPLLNEAASVVRFDSVVAHIGKLNEDDAPVIVSFPFRNVGSAPLVITRVRTNCGCTDAYPDKFKYAVNESGMLTVEYNPDNHPGTVDESTFVYSSLSDVYPIARLTVLGEVLPSADVWGRFRYTFGKLKLKQRTMKFTLTGQSSLTESLLCGNASDENMHLTVEHLPPFVHFRTVPEVIPPGEEADIEVRVDAAQLKETDAQLIPLVLKGTGASHAADTLLLEINFPE